MKKTYNKSFYFIVGEPSGDLHASNLAKNLKKLDKRVCFRGLGGPLMQSEGLVAVDDFSKLSVMGFWEVFKQLLFFVQLKKKIVLDILKNRPDVLILVDYPGFNLKIAKEVRQKNSKIKIIYYISPQLWAWKESRINIIKKYVDRLIVLFPFEVKWYKNRGVDVSFFGHPLVDLNNTIKFKKTSFKNKVVGVFPGSRKQEIKQHVPILKRVVACLRHQNPNIHFVVGLAKDVDEKIVSDLNLKKNFTIIKNNSLKAFHLSDVAIVTSGTATLECALTKTPCVVIYKTSFISWLIAKVFIKVRFVSIVNLLANNKIYEELLQGRCSSELIVEKVNGLLDIQKPLKLKELDSLVASLGNGKSYSNTAKYIFNYEF